MHYKAVRLKAIRKKSLLARKDEALKLFGDKS